MREQNRPLISNPVMKVDDSMCRDSFKVRKWIAEVHFVDRLEMKCKITRLVIGELTEGYVEICFCRQGCVQEKKKLHRKLIFVN